MKSSENIKAYLDNELSNDERLALESQMSENEDLRNEMNDFDQISKSLRASAKSHPVEGFEKTRNLLARQTQKPAWVKILAPVALLAILSAVLIPAFVGSGESVESAAMDKVATAAAAESSVASEAAAPSDFADKLDNRSMAPTNSPAESELAESAKADSKQKNIIREKSVTGQTYEPNRQVIKNGNVDILVPSLSAAEQAVKAIAQRYQGFVESSSSYAPRSESAQRTASYTLRVRSSNFDLALNELGSLGDVTSSSSSGEDVTAQVVDLEARLRTMRIEEAQYMEVLKSTRKIGEILEVKERIYRVRADIESLEAQRKELSSLAQMSTILVNLTEEPKVQEPIPTDWLGNTVTSATNAFGTIGRYFVQVLVYIAVFSPFWLPFVIYWFIKKRKA